MWKESFEKSSYFVHSMMKRKSSVVVTDFTEKKDCGIESNGKKVVIQNRITEYFRDVGINQMDDKEEGRMHEILNEKKKHIVVNNSVVINDSFQLHENNKRVVINLVSDSSDDEEQKEKNTEKEYMNA